MTALSASKSSVSEPGAELQADTIDLWLCRSSKTQDAAKSEDYLRAILSRYLQVSPESLDLARTARGRPFLRGAGEGVLDFNLSHSQDYWLLALSRLGRVGVDIEYCDRTRSLQRLVDRFYTPREGEIFAALPQAQRASYFFDCWTLKEAQAKACGTTMSATVSSAGFNIESGQIVPLAPLSPGEAPKRQFWLFEPRPGWHLALCLQDGPGADVQVCAREWDMKRPARSVDFPQRARFKGF